MRRNPIPIFWAAFGAAVASTAVELPLWWIAGDDVMRNLIRDARLTAAIVMGRRVLASPAGFDALVMGVATVVHFSLSLVYTVVLANVVRNMPFRSALVAGGAFGLVLYGINLHAFTAIFPWFIPVRGVITLVAHLGFGITAAAIYRVVRR
ncbi:sodium:proline symporter [Burkholderia sp. 4701]|nr:sodium:proline symporter [Burkholderia sp. 4701]MXN83735.1 sodium:proline symporter [Burkholderia sp. 4812]